MAEQILLLTHPALGIAGTLAALWLLVETLHASERNIGRIRRAAMASCAAILLAGGLGGRWYVSHYGEDKAVIVASPAWSWAHHVGMETKEHAYFALMLLALYLPIAARGFEPIGADCAPNSASKARRASLIACAACIIVVTIALEGLGALVATGVKGSLMEERAAAMGVER
jgi:hypothetical protein